MNVDGGNLDDATTLDYIMHFFTFGWKVILFEKKPVIYLINS